MPALAGAFTGASDNIIQAWLTNGHTVFTIPPPGGATKIIPAGATQPQLGTDRASFNQNAGTITLSVAVSK